MAIVDILRLLKTEGPMPAERLRVKTGASKKTFYRALGTLKDAELIVDKDGLYYYFEDISAGVYKTKADHEVALRHSEKIVVGLIDLVSGSETQRTSAKEERYRAYALMHIKTGYLEASELYQKLESMKENIETEKQALREEFKGNLVKTFPSGLLHPEHAFTVVYEDIMSFLRGGKRTFLDSFQVQDQKVTCEGYILADGKIARRLKTFLEQEESKENLDYRKIARLENQYFEAKAKFDKEMELLKLRVENGTPLQGRCTICPNITFRS